MKFIEIIDKYLCGDIAVKRKIWTNEGQYVCTLRDYLQDDWEIGDYDKKIQVLFHAAIFTRTESFKRIIKLLEDKND